MRKYQVWFGGVTLFDTHAESEKEARKNALQWTGKKKLPDNTCVCEISEDYYKNITRMNKQQGFNAGNL